METSMYKIDFKKPIAIHFIGIGGISMSGLAEILMREGFRVSGSDAHESELTEHLAAAGAKVMYGQAAANITDDMDLVVYTAAVQTTRSILPMIWTWWFTPQPCMRIIRSTQRWCAAAFR